MIEVPVVALVAVFSAVVGYMLGHISFSEDLP
jgi:hypothetical protein